MEPELETVKLETLTNKYSTKVSLIETIERPVFYTINMGKDKKKRSTLGKPKISLAEQIENDALPKKRNREFKLKFREEEESVS